MGLVFFDFDGTLTTRDTILPLGLFLARKGPDKYKKISLLALRLILLKLRLITNHAFKARFCELLLKNESEEATATAARIFVQDYVQGILRKPVVERLLNHVQKGDEVYLVSSNFGFVLRALRGKWPLNGVVATEAEVDGGRFTGRIAGRSCEGKAKLARVVSRFGEPRVREATAYGDSRGDRELLGFVKNANWV